MKIKSLLIAIMAMWAGLSFAAIPTGGAQGYFYDSASGKFLSYGVSTLANSNDGAVVDFYGRPFTVTYKSDSATTFDDGVSIPAQAYIQRIDRTGHYLLCNSTGVVCDGANYKALAIYEVGGKLVLRCVYNQGYAKLGQFFAINDKGEICLVEGVEKATKWDFVDGATQQSIVAEAAKTRLVTEAAKAGLTVASQSELEAAVAGLSSSDLTSKVTNPTMYTDMNGWTVNTLQGVAINNGNYTIQNASPVQSFTTQSVTGMPAGIYKVTIQAFYRPCEMSVCVDMSKKGFRLTNAYFKANDNQTVIKDWYEIRTDDSNPNSRGAFKNDFNDAKYTNTVYAYVGADGVLDLTIAVPSWSKTSGSASAKDWICFNDVKLTYYYDTESVCKGLQAAIDAAVAECNALGTEALESFNKEVADIVAAVSAKTIEGDGSKERAAIDTALENARLAVINPGDDVTGKIVNPAFGTGDWTGWTPNKVDEDIKGDGGKYVVAAYNHALDFEQTVTNLKPGFYKLSYQAFYRHRDNQTSWNMFAAGTIENLMTIYGNEQSAKAPLVTDYASTELYHSNCAKIETSEGDLYVPNGRSSIVAAFNKGFYKDAFVCFVGEDGTLRIRVENTNEGNNTYAAISNFGLTFLGESLSEEDAAAILASVPEGDMAADAKTALTGAVNAFKADASTTNFSALNAAINGANASIEAIKNYTSALAAAKAASAKTEPMNADVMPACNAALSTYEAESFPTTAEYVTAANALKTAADNVNNSINNYAATKAAIDNIEAYLSRCAAYATKLFEDNNGPAILADAKDAYDARTLTSSRASELSKPYLASAKAKYVGGTDITDQAPESWTGASGNVQGWACPDAEGSPEVYKTKAFTGDVLTMEIADLSNGTYVVKMIGGASYTSGRGFAGATGQNHAYFFANDALQSLEVYDRSSIGAGTVECAELTCNVTDGKLKFGIQNITEGANWFVINLISINKIADAIVKTDVTLAVGESGYATFIAPFQYEVPTGVKAYTVDAVAENGTDLVMTELTTVPANTPVVLTADAAVTTTVSGVSEASGLSATVGLLTGVYGDTEITEGYVLQKQGEKVAFYVVSAENPKTVPAGHAYLTVPGGASVKSFGFDAIATAINGLNTQNAAQNGAIYNVNGQLLGGLQRGINIVNGKKIIIK